MANCPANGYIGRDAAVLARTASMGIIADLLIPDGRMRPYRPCPADFRERFLEMGWDGIEDHYRTNWRVIRRWIEQSGGDELRAARRAVSGGTERPNLRSENRSRRYVMGMTLRRKT